VLNHVNNLDAMMQKEKAFVGACRNEASREVLL
jgi:hypothetical protein